MWFFRKKSAEHALRELVEDLSRVLGENLKSVLLYGSKVSGEYREDRSDVNVFIVLDNISWETLHLMTPGFQSWAKAGRALPVFVKASELQIYADSLPIEFLDMQDHHRVIHGSNPLQVLNVDRANLRAQCEQELAIKQLKLRQAMLVARWQPKRLREILVETLPNVLTLYRAVLRLEGEVPRGNKILAAQDLAKRAGFDGDCLERLWDFHMRRRADNVEDLAQQYLDTLEKVLAYLHRK